MASAATVTRWPNLSPSLRSSLFRRSADRRNESTLRSRDAHPGAAQARRDGQKSNRGGLSRLRDAPRGFSLTYARPVALLLPGARALLADLGSTCGAYASRHQRLLVDLGSMPRRRDSRDPLSVACSLTSVPPVALRPAIRLFRASRFASTPRPIDPLPVAFSLARARLSIFIPFIVRRSCGLRFCGGRVQNVWRNR